MLTITTHTTKSLQEPQPIVACPVKAILVITSKDEDEDETFREDDEVTIEVIGTGGTHYFATGSTDSKGNTAFVVERDDEYIEDWVLKIKDVPTFTYDQSQPAIKFDQLTAAHVLVPVLQTLDLIVNFVWIGPGKLGALEKFMIYSWKAWGCDVNLFTHYPMADKTHNYESLGLQDDICAVHDLPTIMKEDQAKPLGEKTREVLALWFECEIPAWNEGGREQTFNMVDLSKSYIGMHRMGIVFDMKVGPSPYIREYVEKKVFENNFVSYKRCNAAENQCMGSMMAFEDDNARYKYGKGFEDGLFNKGPQHSDLEQNDLDPKSVGNRIDYKWYSVATDAHKKALGKKGRFPSGSKEGLKGEWYDIGRDGKKRHESDGIREAKFVGIDTIKEGKKDQPYFGPIRIFKNEWDQTNKPNNPDPTTNEQRQAECNRALETLNQEAKKSGFASKLEPFLQSPAIISLLG